MVRAMARGGKRAGAGRKKLCETSECHWIVDAVRQFLGDKRGERHARWIRRNLPKEIGAREELRELQEKLESIPVAERAQVFANPLNTPLEDVIAIFDEGQVTHRSQIPSPSHFDLSVTYDHVAVAASKHFQKRITKRQVRRCIQEWMKLEASLKD